MFNNPGTDLTKRMAQALPGTQLSRADKKEVTGRANRGAKEIIDINISERVAAEKMRSACNLYDIGQQLAGEDQGKQQLVAAIIATHVRGPNILGWQ